MWIISNYIFSSSIIMYMNLGNIVEYSNSMVQFLCRYQSYSLLFSFIGLDTRIVDYMFFIYFNSTFASLSPNVPISSTNSMSLFLVICKILSRRFVSLGQLLPNDTKRDGNGIVISIPFN